MIGILHLVLVLAGLMALNEVFRRYKWAAIAFYFVLPLLLIPVWANSGIDHWFRWVKLFSVLFAVVWFTFFRYTRLGERNYAKFVAMLILVLNILEAVYQDASQLQLAHGLNALAGVLNIVTLANWRNITRDEHSAARDLLWPAMTFFWIIAYVIWNWTFVYLNFPENAAYHIMVLLSCTIPAFFRRGAWLQARAFTLAIWMMYLFTFPTFIADQVVWLPRNEISLLLAALASLGVNAAYAGVYFREKRIAQA